MDSGLSAVCVGALETKETQTFEAVIYLFSLDRVIEKAKSTNLKKENKRPGSKNKCGKSVCQ